MQREYPFIVEVADMVRDANEAPPVTVSPVVVALPAIKFARLVKPVTPREPREVPPVTPNEVEVPTVNAKELSWVPPVTLSPPVEVALAKVELADEREPSEVPPVTVNPVVVAFCIKAPTPQFVEVADTENKVEVAPWPLI